MVPFGVPIIIRHLLFRYRVTLILPTTHMCFVIALQLAGMSLVLVSWHEASCTRFVVLRAVVGVRADKGLLFRASCKP